MAESFLDDESKKVKGGPALPYIVQGAKNIADPQKWSEGMDALSTMGQNLIKSPPGGGYMGPGRAALPPTTSAPPSSAGVAQAATPVDHSNQINWGPKGVGDTSLQTLETPDTTVKPGSAPAAAAPSKSSKSTKQPVIKYDLAGAAPTTVYNPSISQDQRAKFNAQPAGMISPGAFQNGPAIPEGQPGEGSFSGGIPTPADYTSEMQAKDVEARQDAGRTAMGSYMQTLDEANANERIHGADMARKVQAFKNQFGVDLKGREFQAKLAELGMQAPKIAAETKLAEAQTRRTDAEAAAVPGKAKDEYSTVLRELIKETAKALPYQDPETQQATRDQIDVWMSEIDNRASGKGKKEVDNARGSATIKPTPEQHTQTMKIIQAQASKNVPWGVIAADLQKVGIDPKAYEAEYLKSNTGQANEPPRTSAVDANIQLASARPEDVPLGSGQAGQTGNLMELQKQYQNALQNDDFDKAEQIKKQMQQLSAQSKNVG